MGYKTLHTFSGTVPRVLWEAVNPATNEVFHGSFPATVEQQHWHGFRMVPIEEDRNKFTWIAWVVESDGEISVRWNDNDDWYLKKVVASEQDGIALARSFHDRWSYTDMWEWLVLNGFVND